MMRAARGLARHLVAVSGGAAVQRCSVPTLQQLREVRAWLRGPPHPSYATPATLSLRSVKGGTLSALSLVY